MREAWNPSQSFRTHRWRGTVAALVLASLAACADWPANDDAPATGELLRNSLPVAAAALSAGQLDVARRLYLSLSERFDHAPEPFLGLGYIAFRTGDSAAAERFFVQASERATDAPVLRAEALLGAGRTALLRGKPNVARRYFLDAQGSGEDTPSAPWIANGRAVVSTLRGDYDAAEAHYGDALRLSSGNPRIAANHIRMLIAAGRIDEATAKYERHPPSWWPDEDGALLSRLIEEARRQRLVQALANPRAGAPNTETPNGPRDAGTAPTGRPEQEIPGLPPSRSLDPDLAMRLYLSDALPATPGADGSSGTSVESSDPLVLMLDFDGLRNSTPRGTAQPDTVATSAGTGDSPRSETTPPRREARPSRTPEPAGPVAHPLPESDLPALVPLEASSPVTVTLNLGQSRRIHLDRDATTVLVASPEVADVRLLAPNVVYVIGKGIGRTSVAMLDDEERIEERIVSVGLDLEPLRSNLAGESDLHDVRVKRLSRGVALTGEVASAASVDRALRMATGTLPEGVSVENDLRVAAPQQVNLEVQIAEVHRSVTEDLGVNWEAFLVRDSGTFGLRIGRVIDGTFPRTLIDGQISPSASFRSGSANPRIVAMIDALATAGLANVLARPNVTAVSGESASFFSGGERPIPTGYDNTTNTILFEYKKVGVLLDFVPTVVDSGRIVLTVRPEVSEPDASQPLTVGPVSLPVINVRRAETTVEVGDGESIVIAGLFSNRSNTTETGLPGLKDVPLLGLLFGTSSIRSNELELIVIVTARLVRAHETPGDTETPAATLQANGYHY